MFPTLGKDLLQGFRLGLGNEYDGVKYLVEGIGNATDDSIIRTAEKLLIQEDVDLVIAFCGSILLESLGRVFESYQKPLFHVDLGSNALKLKHQNSFVAYHSLNLWQSNYTAGKYAADTFGKKGLLAASFYDGGYQHSEALVTGYREAGGELVDFYVAPMDYKNEDFSTLLEVIESKDPEVVFLLFSYKEADKLLQALSKSKLNGKYPFVAMPVLTDESMYEENHGIQQLVSIGSWSFDEKRSTMQEFVSVYQELKGSHPNLIHLLGYEMGQATSQLLETHGEIPSKLSEALQKLTIATPRGNLSYNAYGESQVEEFKIRKFNFNEVRYHNEVIGTVEADFSSGLYKQFEPLEYTGWQNPYICT